MEKYIWCAILVWNTVLFFMYGIDKYKAKKGWWRISENTLVVSALLMGAPGALMGMKTFRHKTRKLKFRLMLPFALLLNLAAVIAYYYFKNKNTG